MLTAADETLAMLTAAGEIMAMLTVIGGGAFLAGHHFAADRSSQPTHTQCCNVTVDNVDQPLMIILFFLITLKPRVE